jgi:hypothetical protein
MSNEDDIEYFFVKGQGWVPKIMKSAPNGLREHVTVEFRPGEYLRRMGDGYFEDETFTTHRGMTGEVIRVRDRTQRHDQLDFNRFQREVRQRTEYNGATIYSFRTSDGNTFECLYTRRMQFDGEHREEALYRMWRQVLEHENEL